MKETQAWTQSVLYVECPYCNYVKDFGNDIVWDKNEEYQCEKCKKVMLVRSMD